MRGIILPFTPKNAFGSDYTQTNDEGVLIQRSSHQLLGKEFLPQKLIRLLERDSFRLLKFLFGNIMNLSYAHDDIKLYGRACEKIVAHDNLQGLLVVLGYTEGADDQQAAHSQYSFSDPVTSQQGSIKIYPGKLIEFSSVAKQVAERDYGYLRSELLAEKGPSTFIDVQNRLDREIAARHEARKNGEK